MSGLSTEELPDAELVRLVAALCDETLDESDRRKLETRLRDDPAALRYCAERIRFESELAETVSPPRKLEWSETRKLLRDGEAGWELRLEQSLRFGTRGHRGRLSRWLDLWSRPWMKTLVISSGIAVAAVGWWALHRRPAPVAAVPPVPSLVLKNADFELPGLERSGSAESFSIVGWQDYHRSDAKIIEIARKTGGKVLARSGRNVVRLEEWDFLTQILTRNDGSPFIANPGKGVRVSGWAYVESAVPAVTIEGSLRYVASPHPAMCQYVPSYARITIPAGKWHPFTLNLVLPENLVTGRVTKGNNVPFPEELDLTGKEMTLSIDNREGSGGALYLDDLRIEEVGSGG